MFIMTGDDDIPGKGLKMIAGTKPRKTDQYISAFLESVTVAQQQPVKELVAARDKALADIAKRQAGPQAALDKARAELEEARQWLQNIPISAEPGDITTRQVIIDRWPARVNQLALEVEPLHAERRKIEQDFNYAVHHCVADVRLQIHHGLQDLEAAMQRVDLSRFMNGNGVKK